MALQVKTVEREFTLETAKGDKVVLTDPHPGMSLQEVINHHSNQYPELITATIEGPRLVGDKATYSFTTVLGDKG